MARASGIQKITGTIDDVTYYRIMGSEQVFMRRKGGPTKNMVKKSARFVNVRLNNEEWKGCTKMGKNIRHALRICNNVTDYPISGALNAIAKRIQKTDTENVKGQRSLLLSQNRDIISGFCVSKKAVPETILRVPLSFNIDRENYSVHVSIPAINPELHLDNFRNLPYFRIVFSLSAVSDMIYNELLNNYISVSDWGKDVYSVYESAWHMSNNVVPKLDETLSLHFANTPEVIPDCITLVLSYSIEFAKLGPDNKPMQVKYAGTGKVLGCV